MMKKLPYLLLFLFSISFFGQNKNTYKVTSAEEPTHSSDINTYIDSGVKYRPNYTFINDKSYIPVYQNEIVLTGLTNGNNISSQLQTAINDADPNTTLIIPNGTYYINTLNYNHQSTNSNVNGVTTADAIRMKSGVVLKGESRTGTIIKTNLRPGTYQLIDTGKIVKTTTTLFKFTNGTSYAGLENLTIQYEANGTEPIDIINPSWTNSDFEAQEAISGTNDVSYFNDNQHLPTYSDDNLSVASVRLENEAINNWIYQCNILESGNTIVLCLGDNNEFRELLVDRAYIKDAGSAYFSINGENNLTIDSEIYRIRHILTTNFNNVNAYPASYNVFYNITTDTDFNHHDGDLGFNLVERCTSDIPSWKGFDGQPWLTGDATNHLPPGPRNRFYKNTILTNRGGATMSHTDPSIDITKQDVIYEFDDTAYQKVIESDQPVPNGGTFYPLGSSITNTPINTSNDIWLEAECAQINGNWSVENDTSASGNQYLVFASGNTNPTPTNSNTSLIFNFNIATTGTYKVYGLVKTPNSNDDSFWVKANDGDWVSWNSIPSNSSFSWQQVHSSAAGPTYVAYNLTAGSNTIEIAYREDGAGLDKIFVTQNTVPSGLGGTDLNCTIPVTGITLSPQNIQLDLASGSTSQLISSTIAPVDATEQNITWTSSDDNIATVDSNGNVTAIAIGTASITATTVDGNFTDTLTVDVTDSYVCQTPVPNTGITPVEITVSTFDSNGPYGPCSLMDNDLNTRWSADGIGNWAVFDLGSQQEFDQIRIAFYNGDIRTTSFDIQVSDDALNWTNVTNSISSGTTTALEAFDFPTQLSRYVRYFGKGNSSNNWNSITEIEIEKVFIPVTGIALDTQNIQLDLASGTISQLISATIAPIDATEQGITWASSDDNIATVDSNGNVTAIAIGTASITATTVDGSFTNTLTVNVNLAGPDEIWLEAECSQIGSNWSIQNDNDASGGEYLIPPSGFNSSPPTNSDSILTFTFSVTNPGLYKLYGLVKVPSSSNDSFYIRVNGGTWVSWNSISGGNYFSWQQVHSSAIGPNYVEYNLLSGSNTIEVGNREDGAGLDKLYITKTGNTPIGFGGNSSNCSVSLSAKINPTDWKNELEKSEFSNYQDLIISPNPTKFSTTITINEPYSGVSQIDLYDLTGRIIKSFEVSPENSQENKFKISLLGMESGLYILQLLNEEKHKIAEGKLLIK